jgi:hypothetical protein
MTAPDPRPPVDPSSWPLTLDSGVAADDPRNWPLTLDAGLYAPRPSGGARVVRALAAHSQATRSARRFELPGIVQEWVNAPFYAKVIMALPVLAVLALIGYLLMHGSVELIWRVGKAAAAGLVMVALCAGWRRLAQWRDGY